MAFLARFSQIPVLASTEQQNGQTRKHSPEGIAPKTAPLKVVEKARRDGKAERRRFPQTFGVTRKVQSQVNEVNKLILA